MSLILHIGFPKTGTTTIQRAFKKNAKKLEKYGIIYPVASGIKQSAVKHILAKTKSTDAERELSELSYAIDSAVSKNPSAHILVSVEELTARYQSVLTDDSVSLVKDYLTKWSDDIHLISYVRRPDAYYMSVMQERIKRGWLPLSPNSFRTNFDGIASIYERVFETDAIIRPFERKQWAGGNILSDFLTQIEKFSIIPDRAFSDTLESSNESLSSEAILALEILYSRDECSTRSPNYSFAAANKVWPKVRALSREMNYNTKPVMFSHISEIVLEANKGDVEKLRNNRGVEFQEDTPTAGACSSRPYCEKISFQDLMPTNEQAAHDILKSLNFVGF